MKGIVKGILIAIASATLVGAMACSSGQLETMDEIGGTSGMSGIQGGGVSSGGGNVVTKTVYRLGCEPRNNSEKDIENVLKFIPADPKLVAILDPKDISQSILPDIVQKMFAKDEKGEAQLNAIKDVIAALEKCGLAVYLPQGNVKIFGRCTAKDGQDIKGLVINKIKELGENGIINVDEKTNDIIARISQGQDIPISDGLQLAVKEGYIQLKSDGIGQNHMDDGAIANWRAKFDEIGAGTIKIVASIDKSDKFLPENLLEMSEKLIGKWPVTLGLGVDLINYCAEEEIKADGVSIVKNVTQIGKEFIDELLSNDEIMQKIFAAGSTGSRECRGILSKQDCSSINNQQSCEGYYIEVTDWEDYNHPKVYRQCKWDSNNNNNTCYVDGGKDDHSKDCTPPDTNPSPTGGTMRGMDSSIPNTGMQAPTMRTITPTTQSDTQTTTDEIRKDSNQDTTAPADLSPEPTSDLNTNTLPNNAIAPFDSNVITTPTTIDSQTINKIGAVSQVIESIGNTYETRYTSGITIVPTPSLNLLPPTNDGSK